ncbi:MAG TPA: endonuclease III [Chloroflexia bacterium]|nr:endonuclease III [Chloroflexia bacterium]
MASEETSVEQTQDWTAFIEPVLDTLEETYFGKGSVELEDPFHVLIATVISQRTREEQTTLVSNRLFARYPDATSLAEAPVDELMRLLHGSSYPEVKAPRIKEIARILRDNFGGQVPHTIDELLALPGVGRKTANCVLVYAFNIAALCVDVHVHRITNRLGWFVTKTPEQTERALEKILPNRYWFTINRLMVQHGRTICLPTVPQCRKCPVQQWCETGQNHLGKDLRKL